MASACTATPGDRLVGLQLPPLSVLLNTPPAPGGPMISVPPEPSAEALRKGECCDVPA